MLTSEAQLSKGYDISDYQKPAPQYGTLEDVDAIIKGCHERGIKVLFDLGTFIFTLMDIATEFVLSAAQSSIILATSTSGS